MNNRLRLNNLTHNQAWLLQGSMKKKKSSFIHFCCALCIM